jgi:cytidine deaminase
MEIADLEVFKHAELAREKAYAPYSGFAVGAALVTEEGERFDGCNVENRSYGLTMCAERVALGAAISRGRNKFQLLAIVSDSAEPIVPCGACRQVLAEFNPNLRILSRNLQGRATEFDLATLLPLPQQGILG